MRGLRVPLLLFAVPAALLGLGQNSADTLWWFDRAALQRGEFWRLWTGHWMHFSLSHLLWNLAVLLAAGTWLERRFPGWLWRHAVVAAPLISLGLFFGEPAMQRYGGLSALATSVVTLLALAQLGARRADRALWSGLLLVIAAKVIHDAGHARALFTRFDSPEVRPSVFAHAFGAAAALALYPFWLRRDTRKPDRPLPLRRPARPR